MKYFSEERDKKNDEYDEFGYRRPDPVRQERLIGGDTGVAATFDPGLHVQV